MLSPSGPTSSPDEGSPPAAPPPADDHQPSARTRVEDALHKAEAARAILSDAYCRAQEALPPLRAALAAFHAAGELAQNHAVPDPDTWPEGLAAAPPQGLGYRQLAWWRDAMARLAGPTDADGAVAGLSRQDLARVAFHVHRSAYRLGRSLPAEQRLPLVRRRRRAVGWAAITMVLVGLLVLSVMPPPAPPEYGWRAEYFKDKSFTGPSHVQREDELAFFWDDRAPVEGFPEDHFYARFDTCLHVAKTGMAAFSMGSDDGSRLYIDGKLVADNWGTHAMKFVGHETELLAGVHHLRVDYWEEIRGAALLLKMGWNKQEPVSLTGTHIVSPGLEPLGEEPCKGR